MALVLLPPLPHATVDALYRWACRAEKANRLTILPTPDSRLDASDRLNELLGRDNGNLFHRFGDDVRASTVAALLGTLRAGSTAVLLLPHRAIYRSALLRRLVTGADRTRLAQRRAARAPRVEPLPLHPPVPARITSAIHRPPRSAGIALAAQTSLLARILDALDVPAASIVLIGPRGSGKSSLLGRVWSHLSATGRPVRTSGPDTGPVPALLLQAPGARHTPAQNLVQTPGDAVLLIDEAASLPLHRVEMLLDGAAPVVLATTTDGYEANGRAFANTLLPRLIALRPQTLVLRVDTHARFERDDAVQHWLDSRLYLPWLAGCTRTAPDGPEGAAVTSRVTEQLRQADGLAGQTFSLLAGSHYRTSLDDLDALLDARLETWVTREGERVVAVACVAFEGRIDPALHGEILAGRRRLHDQLLPQLLARTAADASALQERYARVTRIAVQPDRRRQGLGSALLAAIRAHLPEEVSLGASFADGTDARSFWRHSGAVEFHAGARRNPRSGRHSMAVLSGGSSAVRRVLDRAVRVHQDNMSADDAGSVFDPGLDPGLDAALLQHFALGERGLAETRGALTRAWRRVSGDPDATLTTADRAVGLPDNAGGRQRERAWARWAGVHGNTATVPPDLTSIHPESDP